MKPDPSPIMKADSVGEALFTCLQVFGSRPCLGSRESKYRLETGERPCFDSPSTSSSTDSTQTQLLNQYRWLSYSEVMSLSIEFGLGLLEMGCKPKDFVVMFSTASIEWYIAQV